MKRFMVVTMAVVVVVVLLLVGCAAPAPPAPTPAPAPAPKPSMDPITVTFNLGQWAIDDAPGRTFKWFMDKVDERTKGLIKFKYVGSSSLTKPGEEITALQTGICDVGNSTFVYFPAKLYINGGFCRALPFDEPDIDKATQYMYKLYYDDPETSRILQGEFAKEGLKFLFQAGDEGYVIESKMPITKLEDLRGKKIAAIGYEARFLTRGGATVVGMPVGDRPTALQTGVVEASATPFTISFARKVYEFAPYMIDTGWGAVTGNPVSWNMAKFEKFPADIQKILIDTGKEAFLQGARDEKQVIKEALATRAKSTDKPYIAFAEEEKAKWAAMLGEPVAEWVAEAEKAGLTGADKVVEKYIALQKAAGYKFHKEWKVR